MYELLIYKKIFLRMLKNRKTIFYSPMINGFHHILLFYMSLWLYVLLLKLKNNVIVFAY